MKTWQKTTIADDTKIFTKEFWDRHSKELASGDFWADRIKGYRDNPLLRLQTAIDNLPLPAAFREAAISIRSLIREQRIKSEAFSDHLAMLYWLAAVASFSVAYSERHKIAGYNILESIPAGVLKSLPFSYFELGYKYLTLLNKTDIKWCVELWGEPKNHTTLLQIHKSLWDAYESCYELKSSFRHNLLSS